MDAQARMQGFLSRLWTLQADAGLSDAELARKMGVDQALVSRAKHPGTKSVGSKFLLGAGSVFPELGFLLFPDLSIIQSDLSEVEEKVS